jgi:hypothetical protein
MTGAKKIPTVFQTLSRAVSVMVMIMGLVFLTGANFLVYSDYYHNRTAYQQQESQQGEAPSPVEEKSKSANGGINVQEEYLQEKHSFKELAWLNALLRHRIMDAEKLEIVHYELVSPPPKIS